MPPVSTNVTTKTVTGTKLAVATGFLALAAGLAAASASSTPPTPPPKTEVGCVDSAPIATSTAGTIFFTTSKGQQTMYTDTCAPDGKLVDYFCSADGKVKSKKLDCTTVNEKPSQCLSGGCKVINPSTITDLFVSDIVMNDGKPYIGDLTKNKITITYKNKGDKKPDKPFTLTLSISPAIPDATIDQVIIANPTMHSTQPISKKTAGVYEIPIAGTQFANTDPYVLNSFGIMSGSGPKVQVFFSPFLPPKNFTKFTVTASIDPGKVINEWDEKNNTKKVEIPATNIKLAEAPKPTCTLTLNGVATSTPSTPGNYTIATSITYTQEGKQTIASDKCTQGKLLEYSCKSDGTPNAETVTCSDKLGAGSTCSNGACSTPPPITVVSCKETDEKNDPAVKGVMNKTYSDGSKKTDPDTCKNETSVEQFGCKSSGSISCTYALKDSSAVCVDGACLIPKK